MHRLLWVVQAVLAVLFIMAGAGKLASPDATLTAMFLPPPTFMRVIGGLEILGALGLVLPGLLRIQQRLIPLAAAGLAAIMAGAVLTSLGRGDGLAALIPLAAGGLAAFVAGKRWVLLAGQSTSAKTRPTVRGRA